MEEGMFCTECGTRLREEAFFCHECGMKVRRKNVTEHTQKQQANIGKTYVGESKQHMSMKEEDNVVTIQKAIQKVISIKGEQVLCSKKELCTILEDLVPELSKERMFVEKMYSDELGQMLHEAYRADFYKKEFFVSRIDHYLLEKQGIVEPIRKEFVEIWKPIFYKKTIEVKHYKEYRPALQILKKEYGENIPIDIIRCFAEQNRLFFRFSITIDDIISDLEKICCEE